VLSFFFGLRSLPPGLPAPATRPACACHLACLRSLPPGLRSLPPCLVIP